MPSSRNGTTMTVSGNEPTWQASAFIDDLVKRTYYNTTGDKRYELSNHLGNVLSVVSDKKIPKFTGSSLQYFSPDIKSYSDYYPFGMLVPGRHGNSGDYRYGFNGKEKDDEVKGEGAHYDYGFRIYDPRLGKFLSTDPLKESYPWYSPYHFAGNNPIKFIDLDGLEESIPEVKTNVLIFIETDEDRMAEVERNSTSMEVWKVIYATDIIDAEEQFRKFTGGEKSVKNLVVRSHGAGGSLALGDTITYDDSDGDIPDFTIEPIFVDGVDLANFNHPNGNGTRENLINNELWSEDKYDSVEALVKLGDGLVDDANACFSACDGAMDSRLGDKLAAHLQKVNIYINLGKGGTSGTVSRTTVVKGKKSGEVKSKTTIKVEKLLIPGPLATKKTRDAGFMFYPAGGGQEPSNVGPIEIQDNSDNPLLIPEGN